MKIKELEDNAKAEWSVEKEETSSEVPQTTLPSVNTPRRGKEMLHPLVPKMFGKKVDLTSDDDTASQAGTSHSHAVETVSYTHLTLPTICSV